MNHNSPLVMEMRKATGPAIDRALKKLHLGNKFKFHESRKIPQGKKCIYCSTDEVDASND